MKQLSDLLARFSLSLPPEETQLATALVSHLVADSRQVQAGELFLALKGLTGDGVAYAMQAKARGAWVIGHRAAEGVDWVVPDLAQKLSAVLRWFYDDPSADLRLIGITGTNGKTSTCHYLAHFLSSLNHRVAVMGTVGNGIWGELKASTHTTPDLVSLYRQLAQWRDEGIAFVVMEVSSHAIDQGRIAGLSFEVVALTQVTRDHLDYHGTEAAYRAVKARFLQETPAKHRVLNQDDALGASLAEVCTDVVRYGSSPDCDVRAYQVMVEPDGLFLKFGLENWSWEGSVPVYGQFNAENIFCALACMLAMKMSFKNHSVAMTQLQTVTGRMQWVRRNPVVVVDYAHTPDALEKALTTLRAHCVTGKLWVVFGAGGDRDMGKRSIMGQIAEALADVVLVTDDNPRSEVPQAIADAILSGMQHPEQVQYLADRRLAICTAIAEASREDIILIAGKGHETYQEVQGVRLPFSDREVAYACQE
jgi:UDP-N-acetylmuramoyl-L-alanyl-D-glutamate--2,6-diaminopimelate ligase